MPYCSFACSAFALLVDGNVDVSVFPRARKCLYAASVRVGRVGKHSYTQAH